MDTRAQLQKALNLIEAYLPGLLDAHPDPAEFWPAFAGEADVILDGAPTHEQEWVADRLESMLTFTGRQHHAECPTGLRRPCWILISA